MAVPVLWECDKAALELFEHWYRSGFPATWLHHQLEARGYFWHGEPLYAYATWREVK